MNAIDEYDIREAFDALDVECRARLSFDELQTLYLGLGFSSARRMTVQQLRQDARRHGVYHGHDDSLSLPETLKLFQKVRYHDTQNCRFDLPWANQNRHAQRGLSI